MKKRLLVALLSVMMVMALLPTSVLAKRFELENMTSETDAVLAATNEGDESAFGNYASPYVSIAGAGKKVTYTLAIDNVSQNDQLASLTIIDKLPRATADKYVLGNNDRGSEFTVLFNSNPEVVLFVLSESVQTQINQDNYTVRFGDSNGSLDSDSDWSDGGSDGSVEWGTLSDGKNTIRIAFASDYYIEPGESIIVSFSAVTDDDADFGETAWNSFGYSYMTNSEGTLSERIYAEPSRVGISVPGAEITVTNNVSGDPVHPSIPFTYLLKQGESVLGDLKYTLGGSDQEFRTGNDGSFTLHANQTATFFVAPGENYSVEEPSMTSGFTATGMTAATAGDGTYSNKVFTFKQLSDGDSAGVAFNCLYTAPDVEVTVWPGTERFVKGDIKQFTASVDGQGEISQAVFWTVEGGVSGTSIDASGNLTVAENETATTLIVRATPIVNITQSGTATVEVISLYAVTLPNGTGYTATVEGSSKSPVAKGGSYSFKITLNEDYEKDASFAVKANDTVLTPSGDVYTIENITSDQIITVQGVVIKDADYDDVDEAIRRIPTDLTLYTDASANAVNAAKDAVERDKKITEQETVDGYADAINDAISALEYKGANYNAVDEAIGRIPTDLTLYTDASVNAVNAAKDAVERDKNITEQEIVDAYATAIENAIAALEEKQPSPSTGDACVTDLWVALMLISGLAALGMTAKRIKNK